MCLVEKKNPVNWKSFYIKGELGSFVMCLEWLLSCMFETLMLINHDTLLMNKERKTFINPNHLINLFCLFVKWIPIRNQHSVRRRNFWKCTHCVAKCDLAQRNWHGYLKNCLVPSCTFLSIFLAYPVGLPAGGHLPHKEHGAQCATLLKLVWKNLEGGTSTLVTPLDQQMQKIRHLNKWKQGI